MKDIKIYERNVVFVQRVKGRVVESFAKYADLDTIIKNKIIKDINLDKVEFIEDENTDQRTYKSIELLDKNIRITGHIERLIISLIDPEGEESSLYKVAKSYSQALEKEDISGIGVNFNGVIEHKKAEELLKEKVISKSPGIFGEADLSSYKLIFNEPKKAMFIISFDLGNVTVKGKGKKEGILVNFNYHREIKTIQLMNDKIREFQDSLEKIKIKYDEKKEKIESFFNE